MDEKVLKALFEPKRFCLCSLWQSEKRKNEVYAEKVLKLL